MGFLLGMFLAGITCAILSSMMAQKKNRSAGGWAAAGFFFGLPALLIVVVLPALTPVKPLPPTISDNNVEQTTGS